MGRPRTRKWDDLSRGERQSIQHLHVPPNTLPQCHSPGRRELATKITGADKTLLELFTPDYSLSFRLVFGESSGEGRSISYLQGLERNICSGRKESTRTQSTGYRRVVHSMVGDRGAA